MSESKTVGAVERSIKIIEEVEELEGARITELSDRLGMAESSVHSHLTTLEKHGYIVKEGGIYDISLKTLGLGRYTKRRNSIFRLAKPKVEEIASETGEVASLFAEDHGMGRFIHGCRGDNTSQPPTEGKKARLHTAAPGKVLLAYYPQERVERIISDYGLTKRTKNTITDEEELFDELEQIRSEGVAFNHGEFVEGLRAVGVPIKGPTGQVMASLSVYGPSYRLTGDFFREEIPNILTSAANDIHLEDRFGEAR
jgi:DNA-binding IclR family transcriptional regulator